MIKEQKILKKAKKIADPFKRQLYVIGILTKILEKFNVRPVVVGGFALEFYTTGGYNTGDIDLVFADYGLLSKIMVDLGFERVGRHWISKELDVFIEAPGSNLTEGEKGHLSRVEIDDLHVYLIGIEDLIVDRMNAYVHWKSQDDGYWVKELLSIHKGKFDRKYLNKRCKEEKTLEAFKKLEKDLKGIVNNEKL
ncbi:MAG: DUF6036 family nucleotidyltransferase [bacterium]